MLNRILVKLMVLFSVFIFASCTTSDEYEDEAEISNSNSENVAISDEAQEGENGEDVNNTADNEFESDEFNNNEGEYAQDNIENYNNGFEGETTANAEASEPVEDLSLVGDSGAESNAALEEVPTNETNTPAQNTEVVEETTEETYEASVPSQETAPLPAYTQGQGKVKYVHQNTSVYGEKNSSYPVGSYEVGDHPLVIDDDGNFATTSSGKYIPSSSLSDNVVARPRRSVEFR